MMNENEVTKHTQYSSQTEIWLSQPMTITTPHKRQDGRFQVNVCSATCDATFAMVRATTEEGATAIAKKFADGWNNEPELLEACKRMIASIGQGGSVVRSAQAKMRVAIAKAEGK